MAEPTQRDSKTPSKKSENANNATPHRKKNAGCRQYSVEQMDRDELHQRIATETRGKFCVGMSADDFFDNFMPWNDNTSSDYRQRQAPASRVADLKAMPSASQEAGMYPKFISAMEGWPLDSSAATQPTQDTHIFATTFGKFRKPDRYCEGAAVDVGHYASDELPPDDATDHSKMQTQGEFKLSAEADPFVDDPPPNSKATKAQEPVAVGETELGFRNERATKVGRETRGQIGCYAALSMHMSYREHLFTYVVTGKYVRFIRWDRRGAFVTRRIDYTVQPEIFFEFFLRFAQLTLAQRGFDETVQELSPADAGIAAQAEAAFSKYSEDMLHCEARATPEDTNIQFSGQLLKTTVDFGDGARTFIIPAPKFHSACVSPFSRSTRRCLVYDPSHLPDTSGIMFMKDYWRQDSPRTKPESEIYKLLAKHEIKHVAKMEVGGDVPGMVTRWQEKALGDLCYPLPDGWREAHGGALQCHRVFLSTVARGLTAFGTVRVLLNSVADAAEAAQMAFDKARILHRDISVGNIMIVREKDGSDSGLLIDWDHCLILGSEGLDHHRGERTGTWQFMSIHILQKRDDNLIQGPVDDRESIFWVLYYVALRYIKNKKSPADLYKELFNTFDDAGIDDLGRDTGGLNKELTLEHFAGGGRQMQFDIAGLHSLFVELARVFFARYDVACTEEEVVNYETLLATFGPDSEVLKFHPYHLQKQRTILLENPTWLQDTLRKHSQIIPLPSNPDSSSSHKVYDYHLNLITPTELISTPARARNYLSRICTTRMDGLTGNLIRTFWSTTTSKRKEVPAIAEANEKEGEIRSTKKARKTASLV